MKGGKVEGKAMDPLFPRLHIDDAGKGGPRPPPRNKMALCQQYNLPSPSSKLFNSGSIAVQPLSTSNGVNNFVSQVYSSNVGSTKQKVVIPTFCSVPGSSNLVERYHSYYSDGLNLNTSVSTSELGISRSIICQVPLVSGNLMPKPFLDKEKNSTGVELHDSCLKEQNEIRSEKINNLSLNTNEKSSFVQEGNIITDDTCRMPDRIMRKRCYSAINESSRSFPLLENNKTINDKDSEPMRVQNNENRQESSDTLVGESLPGLGLTPDDIVGVIGQRLFWKARKTIVNQQKLFAMQIFELHRLIKVQTLISQENTNSLKKPFIKFPPMNKLLYVAPLDQSPPIVTKPKPVTLKPNPSQDHDKDSLSKQLSPPTINGEKRHISQQSIPKPLFYHSLPTSQWLIPVKSPSEGLIYKPYTGPYPPAGGVLPIYGNCGPIRLSTVGGPTAYGVPTPNQLGVGHFSGNTLGQSYCQPYSIPLLNASCPSLEVEHSSRLSGVVSECEENVQEFKEIDLQGRSVTSPCKGEELSLFPTTPSVEGTRNRCFEQPKVQVIKVVPHNPMSASQSAARIFQSIQEERKATL